MQRHLSRYTLPLTFISALLGACHRPPPRAPRPPLETPSSHVATAQRAFWAPGRLPTLHGLPQLPALVLPQLVPIPGPSIPAPSLPKASRGQQAAAYARARVGKRYCWGGTGPDCYDCSGLTSEAWRHAGEAIPRTSGAQRARIAPVPMSALAVGDVLWRPGHVGLYVGNGLAVHAPGRGKRIQYQRATKFREAHRPGLRVLAVR